MVVADLMSQLAKKLKERVFIVAYRSSKSKEWSRKASIKRSLEGININYIIIDSIKFKVAR